MTVIFDANVFLSYLLAPGPHQTIPHVVRSCFRSPDITVLAPKELIQEVTDTALKKRYFRDKLSRPDLESFLDHLVTHADVLPALKKQAKRYARDHADDYLVAYAVLHDVDYLVTGDGDLLVLEQVDRVKIVTPFAMRRVLEQRQQEQ